MNGPDAARSVESARSVRREILRAARAHRQYAWDMEQLGVSRFSCSGWHYATAYRAAARLLRAC